MEHQVAENNSASPAVSNGLQLQNPSAGLAERKNFLRPQFENALEKREKFAVNLRKKKTQEIVKAKRRKIIEALCSKGKGQVFQELNGIQVVAGVREDAELSVEEMQHQLYQGYPEWRKNKYVDQEKLLLAMGTPAEWEAYATSGNTQKVQYLLNLLMQQQNEAIEQLALITKVRQEVANGQQVPQIDEIVSQTSILEVLSQVLGAEDGNDLTRYLKLEATWILTNLAYGSEQDLMVVLDSKFAILHHLNRILEGNDLQMIDQVIWFIANACGESLNLRNLILTQTTIIEGLTRIISDAQRMNADIQEGLLKSVIWCVCNICRTKKGSFPQNQDPHATDKLKNSLAVYNQNEFPMHYLSMEEYQQILHIIMACVDCKDMSRSMVDAMWALAYIAQSADDSVITQICQSQSLIAAVISHLTSDSQEEQVPALRAAGNILATSNQENVDIFIFHEGLDALSQLLEETENKQNLAPASIRTSSSQLIKEICWSLSNVTAGSNENIESFLEHPKLIGQIYTCMKSQILEIRREATYVMTNAITTAENISMLVFISKFSKGEIIKIFANNLKINDVNIILEIIQALSCLLKLDASIPLEGEDSIAYIFEMEGGLEELESLQKHPNVKVYQEIEQLISENFTSETDNDMIYQGHQNQMQKQARLYQCSNLNQNNGDTGNSHLQQGADANMFQI